MGDLKNCPFCGGEAVMETFTTAMEKKPRFRVRCTICPCDLGWDHWSDEEARDAWNKRTEGKDTMAELEKVLNALENCTAKPKCRDCGWKECEYEHETVEIPLDLAKAALSLLKAQEPRVMTLEEAYCADECWYESVNGSYGYCDLCYDSKEDLAIYTTYGIKNAIESAYNKTWRCWTSRPTDEQMEKVKWE